MSKQTNIVFNIVVLYNCDLVSNGISTKMPPIEWLRERTEHFDIFLFPPITQWCSISDVLFTGGRGVSDFSALQYY